MAPRLAARTVVALACIGAFGCEAPDDLMTDVASTPLHAQPDDGLRAGERVAVAGVGLAAQGQIGHRG